MSKSLSSIVSSNPESNWADDDFNDDQYSSLPPGWNDVADTKGTAAAPPQAAEPTQEAPAKPKNVWGARAKVEAVDLRQSASQPQEPSRPDAGSESGPSRSNDAYPSGPGRRDGPSDSRRDFDGPRGGYDGPRGGGYDGPRGGGYDGPRGGYDGPRGGGYDGPRGGYDGQRERGPRGYGQSRPQNPIPDGPPYTAFVGNIPRTTVEDDLRDFFGAEGVREVRLVRHRDSGDPKMAYIEFVDRDALEKSLSLDGESVMGFRLRVDVAEQKQRPGGPTRRDGSSSISDREMANFRANGPAAPPPRERFGDRGDRGDRRYGDRSDRGRGFADARQSRGPPKLNLEKRSEDSVARAQASVEASPSTKPNPFGAARPRDENAIMAKKEAEWKEREAERERENAAKAEQKKLAAADGDSERRGNRGGDKFGSRSFTRTGSGESSEGDSGNWRDRAGQVPPKRGGDRRGKDREPREKGQAPQQEAAGRSEPSRNKFAALDDAEA